MKIKSIIVGGFKNLKKTQIDLDQVAAIISTNNYGKSNLLEAINFGMDFIVANAKGRKTMMAWAKGIPLTPALENEKFYFQIEFYEPKLGDYCYVRYGYSFSWYRDDGSGQHITDEWIDARNSESVRYTQYLKRDENKFRKSKSTVSFRSINLDSTQLAIDVLAYLDNVEIDGVALSVQSVGYRVCSSLDLCDRFQLVPFEYVSDDVEGGVAFDDEDIPRALYVMRKKYPEQYSSFLEAIYTLFPEFTDVQLNSMELKLAEGTDLEVDNIQVFVNGKATDSSKLEKVPFRIKDAVYRLFVSSKYLNQSISVSSMSTGTKRLIWLLTNIFLASSAGINLLGIEEVETSIHPRMLKNLLEILTEAGADTSLIISSHSPYLVQYLKLDRLYLGVPNNNGVAVFRKIRKNKMKALISLARDLELSVGEYLFELLSGDADSMRMLATFLEEPGDE